MFVLCQFFFFRHLSEGIFSFYFLYSLYLDNDSSKVDDISFAAGIHGGHMLGVRSVSGLAFYDWETAELVRRIEASPKSVRQFFF